MSDQHRTMTFGSLLAYVSYSVRAACPACGSRGVFRMGGDQVRAWREGRAELAYQCPTCGSETTLDPKDFAGAGG